MATYLVVLSGFNEAIAVDDWIRILKEAVSLKVVRCIAVGTIDHLGFSKVFKINFFRAKIASALKGPIWTVPIIKYGTNCYGRLFKKLWFEEFFFLRIFSWINPLGEQSTWAWPFLWHFTVKIIFQFDTCFASAAMTKFYVNKQLLISAQHKYPTSFPWRFHSD